MVQERLAEPIPGTTAPDASVPGELEPGTSRAGSVPTRTVILAILGVTALVIASFLVGRFTVPSDATPNDTSAEAGFSRDMQLHHLQAVEMSMIVRDATDDPDIRLLAYDIALAQQQQAGQMYSWLTVWGLPQVASEPSMTWMMRPGRSGTGPDHGSGDPAQMSGMPMPGMAMPGMATEAQLAELRSATGIEAEKLYLELMIAHHRGGVGMAKAILDRSTNRVVVTFARAMIAAQQSEIDYIEKLLAQRQ